ncbi:unnamed protein product [Didymodactylos carnosus]|nr:unnamed protein product [Didymodactylos carnosus]CAF4408152.1 unnamed protein product [Didymodactylos carnosus]
MLCRTSISFLVFLSTVHSLFAAAPWEDEVREQWWFDRHNGFLNQIRANASGIRVVFLGDSITEGWLGGARNLWNQHYAARGAVNFGIGGDRTQHILWRIHNGELDGIQPKLIVLKIGTNNVGGNTADDITRGITKIVQDIRAKLPQARLLLLSILPRNNGAFNNKIPSINTAISKLDDNYWVKYLDLTWNFQDAVDHVIPELFTADLLHLALP